MATPRRVSILVRAGVQQNPGKHRLQAHNETQDENKRRVKKCKFDRYFQHTQVFHSELRLCDMSEQGGNTWDNFCHA